MVTSYKLLEIFCKVKIILKKERKKKGGGGELTTKK